MKLGLILYHQTQNSSLKNSRSLDGSACEPGEGNLLSRVGLCADPIRNRAMA